MRGRLLREANRSSTSYVGHAEQAHTRHKEVSCEALPRTRCVRRGACRGQQRTRCRPRYSGSAQPVVWKRYCSEQPGRRQFIHKPWIAVRRRIIGWRLRQRSRNGWAERRDHQPQSRLAVRRRLFPGFAVALSDDHITARGRPMGRPRARINVSETDLREPAALGFLVPGR